MSEDFYQSTEWIRIRYQAIKRYGPVCQCCGSSGSKDNPIQVDHIKSRYLFPELALDITNLQILCKQCNMGKGYKDKTDWRYYIAQAIRPKPPTLEQMVNSLKPPMDKILLAELKEMVELQKQARIVISERDQRRLNALKAELERRRALPSVKRDLFA